MRLFHLLFVVGFRFIRGLQGQKWQELAARMSGMEKRQREWFQMERILDRWVSTCPPSEQGSLLDLSSVQVCGACCCVVLWLMGARIFFFLFLNVLQDHDVEGVLVLCARVDPELRKWISWWINIESCSECRCTRCARMTVYWMRASEMGGFFCMLFSFPF